MNILEIENLSAAFPGKPVLHDINLNVRRGRKLAIVGESGSGKTTLLNRVLQDRAMAGACFLRFSRFAAL